MNHSMLSALSTMKGLQQKINMAADHIANLDTVGYKRQHASFQDILTTVQAQPKETVQLEGRMTPHGLTNGWGSAMTGTKLDFTQGSLKETGLETDLALVGQVMLQVQRAERDEDGNPLADEAGNLVLNTYYTRNGALQYALQPDDPNGKYLANADGDLLRDADTGLPLRIPQNSAVEISENGVITAYNKSNSNDPGTVIGRLAIFEVIRPQSLEKIGEHLYAVPEGTEQPERIAAPVNWDNPGDAMVKQRFLEQSNVNLMREMTDLLQAQRAYQLNARAISSAEQMLGMANNLRG